MRSPVFGVASQTPASGACALFQSNSRVPPPPAVTGVPEARSGGEPHEQPDREVAVVVKDGDVGLVVPVQIDGDRLHRRDVELIRAGEEPLRVRELAVRLPVQNDDAQAEVVVRVVDGSDLLRAVTSEVPDEREAVCQRLRRGAFRRPAEMPERPL